MAEDDDNEILEAEMSLMAEIHSCTSLHRLPIMTLGSGRGTLADKYLCVLHAMFLEAGGTAMSLQDYTDSFVIGTFDLGVEFSLNAILPDRIQNLLPWAAFTGGIETPQMNDESEFETCNSEETDCHVSLQSMLAAPGPMHILDNATNSLMDSVPYLNTVLEPLTALSKLLAHSATCQRLVATCFCSALGQTFKRDIMGYHSKVHSGRWGTLAFSVRATLNLEVALRQFWDLRKYRYGSIAAVEREHQDDVVVGHDAMTVMMLLFHDDDHH